MTIEVTASTPGPEGSAEICNEEIDEEETITFEVTDTTLTISGEDEEGPWVSVFERQ